MAVGLQYGVPLQTAAESLATLSAGDKRGEILHIGGATVINDCYNSNPKALDSMVRSLAEIPARRRIVVAGEMLELGPAAEAMHRNAGQHMAQAGIECCWGFAGWRRQSSKRSEDGRNEGRICAHAGRGGPVVAPRG